MKSKTGSVPNAQNPMSLLQKLPARKTCLQAHSNEDSWATCRADHQLQDDRTALTHSNLRRVEGKSLRIQRKENKPRFFHWGF